MQRNSVRGNYYFPDITESHFDNIMEKTPYFGSVRRKQTAWKLENLT